MEQAKIKMKNENQNKLFILLVGIEIGMNRIAIDMFTLSRNENRLLQITKPPLVNYCHYLL